MKLHPNPSRRSRSRHVDKRLSLKCVGATHQCLCKPCDPDSLKHTLLRAAALEASLDSDRLRQLVSRMDRLPSIPSAYSEIVEKLQDPDTSLDEVGAIIARDLGMTANILKLVNSAFFGLPRQISSPAEAGAYLGVETLTALALSIPAFSHF